MSTYQQQWGAYCRHCGKYTMHVRTVHQANHVLHALLTLFLCGLWLPVWIVAALLAPSDYWRCSQCGSARSK